LLQQTYINVLPRKMFFLNVYLLSFSEGEIALTFCYLNKKKLAHYSNRYSNAGYKTLQTKNMKHKLTLAVISIIIMGSANAQVKFGVQAGANIANWQGDALKSLNNIVDLTNGFIDTKSKTGFHVGGFANIPITTTLSFEPGVQYSQKGYTLKGDLKIDALEFLGANASAKVEAHYIDIPLVVKAEVAKGLSVYAGPQISYLVKNNLHVNAGVLGISLLNRRLSLTDNFNRMDIGIAGGIGYKFNSGLNINAGYDYGLSKLDKNSNFKAYNRVIKLSVGFTF
jgi:hypothetical protein